MVTKVTSLLVFKEIHYAREVFLLRKPDIEFFSDTLNIMSDQSKINHSGLMLRVAQIGYKLGNWNTLKHKLRDKSCS